MDESIPSRRTILRAAGALGITGAALRGMPASAATAEPASAAAASRIAPFAGANTATFATMLSGTPRTPPTGLRIYLDAVTYPNIKGYAGVSWPDITAKYHSPAHALVSIRPDVEKLNAGMFDAELYAFMRSAPAGPASLLTMWHECATFTHSNARYPQKPALFRAGLRHLQRLAAGEIHPHTTPTNVKVGVIDINPTYINASKNYKNDPPGFAYKTWMAANLDWYGCDLYDNRSMNISVYGELNAFRDDINKLPGSVPNADWPVNLPECNSRIDPKTKNSTIKTTGPTGFRRSDFFHYSWSWLRSVGPGGHCSGLLGFWENTGGEGSAWPPKNTPKGSLDAMIAELNAENAQSRP